MVSHEFRTPLAIIQSSAELLREFFQKCSRPNGTNNSNPSPETRAAYGMMEGILVLSRLDTGKLDFGLRRWTETFCCRVVDEVAPYQPPMPHRSFPGLGPPASACPDSVLAHSNQPPE
jgi:signal transduction histidine kinase